MHDRYGCPDADGDGYSNPDLDWPAHPEGFADAFPGGLNAECGDLCVTQWHDVDGDGYEARLRRADPPPVFFFFYDREFTVF